MGYFSDRRKSLESILLDTYTTQMLHRLDLVLHNFRPIEKVCR